LVGERGVTVVLHPALGAHDYFLETHYRTSAAARVDLTVRDRDGALLPSRDASTWQLVSGSSETITALGYGRPLRLTFTAGDPAADVCLTSIAVGLPHPASP
jgi:hypothetical protein